MNSRLDLVGASVLPWAFPALDQAAEPRAPSANEGGVAEPAPAANGSEDLVAQLIAQRTEEAFAEGLQRGLAEGRVKGYAVGLEEGVEAGRQRLAAQAQRLGQVVAALSGPIAALEPALEDAVVALALEVARCVIGAEVSHSREYLVRLIREAIAKVPIEMGAPQIALHPADLALVKSLAPEIEQASAVLVADEAIEPGGCLVVAKANQVPARDVQWQPRAGEGLSQVDLTLASRWRSVMLTLFDAADD